MSTIVIVKKNGVAAIGADTLAKYGSVCESAKYIANATKINRVGKSFMAHVGHVSLSLVLESCFSQLETPPPLDSVQAIFETARWLQEELKQNYFLNPIEDSDAPFESLQSQWLIANPSGIYGLYSLRSVQEYKRFYALGSGLEFALGAMHALYDSDCDAATIARAGLEASAEFDHSTAGPFEIHEVKLKSKKVKSA